MKKLLQYPLALLSLLVVGTNTFAQEGTIRTVAGCLTCVSTTMEGAPATTATFYKTTGITANSTGDVYIADSTMGVVRRVDHSSNRIYTVAGSIMATASGLGDGWAATAALLAGPQGICMDADNNLYIADRGHGRIRKVISATGIINTIAGGDTATADGISATSARIDPYCVYVDAAGTIYTGGINKVRKVTAGIITTIAGTGAASDFGDGGPATNAGILGPVRCITMDAAGNTYVISANGNSIRKINASTGIITTVAGGGTSTADSVQATTALLTNLHSCGIDELGNIIVADRGRSLIRKIDATSGLIYTLAGGCTSTAEGVPGLSASTNNYMLHVDIPNGNIYYSTNFTWARKLAYTSTGIMVSTSDRFIANYNALCSGPEVCIRTNNFYPGMSVKTFFGDSLVNTSPITNSCGKGYAAFTHNYAHSGTYTILNILYSGSTPVDSITTTYHHQYCTTFLVNYYVDGNGDCSQDSNEISCLRPILTAIDSNGVPLDTVSSTSGFYFKAYGNTGDVYTFKMLTAPRNLTMECPTTGVLMDTLQTNTYNTKSINFGFGCTDSSYFNLAVNAIRSRTGSHRQEGTICVSNLGCVPVNAVVKMHFSSAFRRSSSSSSYYIGTVDTIMEWRIPMKSNGDSSLEWLNYELDGASLRFGDAVFAYVTIAPITGDYDTSDNIQNHVDTAQTSFDPNYVEVSPAWCFDTDTQFTYTVHFENTGNAPAENIYVIDTVSTEVVPGTMRIVSASAKMMVTKLADLPGQTVYKFDFPNIMLPDSSHHGECQGYVKYTIRTRPGLPIRSVVRNRAAIFFDYNDPVLTNVTETVKGCATLQVPAQELAEATITPNPVANELTITTGTNQYHHCTITNTLGQVVVQQPLQAATTRLQVGQLPKGMYFVLLQGKAGKHVQKVIKL